MASVVLGLQAGIAGGAEVTFDGQPMQRGTHLRWGFSPELGFPAGGFWLCRKVIKGETQQSPTSTHGKRKQLVRCDRPHHGRTLDDAKPRRRFTRSRWHIGAEQRMQPATCRCLCDGNQSVGCYTPARMRERHRRRLCREGLRGSHHRDVLQRCQRRTASLEETDCSG